MLLVIGLGRRFAALALFILNIVAVISYPDLSELGLKDHQVGGIADSGHFVSWVG